MRVCCRRDGEAHHSLSSVKKRAGRALLRGAQRLSLRSGFVDHDGHSPNGLAALAPIIREGISDSLPHITLAGDLSGPLVHILFVLLEPDPYLHTTLLPCRAGFRSALSPAPPPRGGWRSRSFSRPANKRPRRELS